MRKERRGWYYEADNIHIHRRRLRHNLCGRKQGKAGQLITLMTRAKAELEKEKKKIRGLEKKDLLKKAIELGVRDE